MYGSDQRVASDRVVVGAMLDVAPVAFTRRPQFADDGVLPAILFLHFSAANASAVEPVAQCVCRACRLVNTARPSGRKTRRISANCRSAQFVSVMTIKTSTVFSA
ncbi:MAG: hypothetical protein R3C10_21070 [Pirellulales bacterium]